jgi:TetR/AcrR family transcriptional regulator, transcriptional repressor for nem operon
MPIQKTTEKEIIIKSIHVFRQKGYYRTTMNDLAKETGLTKGSFYHYFSSKEEVMIKALRATSIWFEKKVFSYAYDKTRSKKDRLQSMSDVTYKTFTENIGGCYFANTILETAQVEDTFITEIKLFFTLWQNAFREIFEERYQGDVLDDIIHQIIGDIEGSIIIMQLHNNPIYLQKALKRAVNLL